MGLATNLERLNGTKCRLFLKNGHIGRRKRVEILPICILFDLNFRQNGAEFGEVL